MARNNWVVIGISGVTCGGKTTLAKTLHRNIPDAIIMSQDDYFLPVDSDKHTYIPELNHINFDILSAFDMDKLRKDVADILNSVCKNESPVLIIEGLLIFNDEKLAKLFDKKYFFTLPYEVCLERRSKRSYEPPDVPGYFENYVWPEYLKSKDEAMELNQDIHFIDGVNNADTIIDKVLTDIKQLVDAKRSF